MAMLPEKGSFVFNFVHSQLTLLCFFLQFYLFKKKCFLKKQTYCKGFSSRPQSLLVFTFLCFLFFTFLFCVRFVLVCNKVAIGAIIAVSVTRAFRVDSEHTSDAIVHCSSEAVPVKMGVSRIWVHRDHRRKVIVVLVLCFMCFENMDCLFCC
jgi:hypothetical protein